MSHIATYMPATIIQRVMYSFTVVSHVINRSKQLALFNYYTNIQRLKGKTQNGMMMTQVIIINLMPVAYWESSIERT